MTSRSFLHVADCLYVDPRPFPRFVMVAQMDAKMVGVELSKKIDKMSKFEGSDIIRELRKFIDVDERREYRQYGLVTFDDEYFQFTGNQCCALPEFPEMVVGHEVKGAGHTKNTTARFLVAVQANSVSQTTLGEMMNGFEVDPLEAEAELRGGNRTKIAQDSSLRASLLGLRVMAALKAGAEAGGDLRHGPKMNVSYSSAAFVLVTRAWGHSIGDGSTTMQTVEAEPLWIFHPEASPDGRGSAVSRLRNESLVLTTSECLDGIHNDYLSREMANLKSHGCYSRVAAARWPWAPRHGTGGLYFQSGDTSIFLISRHLLSVVGYVMAAFILMMCCFACRKASSSSRSSSSTYGTMAKTSGS